MKTADREWRTEAVGGEFGYIVRARVREGNGAVDVEALECNGELSESAVVARGWVKFDGCSDLEFGEGSSGAVHFCNARDVDNFKAMLDELYSMARGIMIDAGTWQGDRRVEEKKDV